ncbi:MAG: RtcB family protein [Candidatus Woesearchaeota archaeon]
MKLAIPSDTNDHIIKSAIQNIASLTRDIEIERAALLPDCTPSNTLPTGTTLQISQNQPISPQFIGMDIGCGYRLSQLDIPLRRIYSKGALKRDKLSKMVRQLSNAASPHSKTGTLGKGNHFANIYAVFDVTNQAALNSFGIKQDKPLLLIHSGSRLKGYAVFTEFQKNGTRQVSNHHYLDEFLKAQQYAKVNREILALRFLKNLGTDECLLLDIPHNTIREDNGSYIVQKGTQEIHPGDLGVIPGTATTPGYLVIGGPDVASTAYTINHGVGRKFARNNLNGKFGKGEYRRKFANIELNVSAHLMADEIAQGYRDIHSAIDCLQQHNLAYPIAKIQPLGVVVER